MATFGQLKCPYIDICSFRKIIGLQDCTNFDIVPYEDVPPIRVYFLAFESKKECLFSSLTLKQGAKSVLSLQARVHIHSTV